MNKLANSKSAFLRESTNHPIDWFLWGEEAFEKAKRENKPVLVDVGAAWCHWCHVMDESYEDPEVVKIVNENFMAIKVDRDEMPDLDRTLQNLVYSITGESGWPLTVFMTPDKKVFFGGTYFPPEDSYGRIGLKRLLREILRVWNQERGKIESSSIHVANLKTSLQGNEKAEVDIVASTYSAIVGAYDIEYGGIGTSAKFPHPKIDQFLFAYTAWTGEDLGRKLASFTLSRMYYGGLFDQAGGGFHRYTVDREWTTPHFEKLLIDNAELIYDYFNGYIATGDAVIKDALDLTVQFLLRDLMREGSFANSIDADSDGVEGGYYTWTEKEMDEALGEESRYYKKVFGIFEPGGEVEGRKVLRLTYEIGELARSTDSFPEQIIMKLWTVREKLREYRDRTRSRPFVDENAYTHPNCVAAESLLYASLITGKGREEALAVVGKLGKKVSRRLDGGDDGLLEDYASALNALIAAYEVTSDRKYLQRALDVYQELSSFEVNGKFVDSFGNIPKHDMPNESPVSSALRGIYKLELLDYAKVGNKLDVISGSEDFTFLAGLVNTLGAYLKGGAHVVVVDEKDGKADELHREALLLYYPFKVVERVSVDHKDEVSSTVRSMINEGKGRSRAFVCVGNTCSLPVTDGEKVKALLRTKLT
ncbi:MAG: hypothetical protein ASUL_03714 [Candidatus Aramenus sulfurataquae]|jgi:uncharacterized protein YyaL (SSP411 family)|uniref:Thioredoxin n=2 Tax=Candidatus Aramenus sulfurataquae TaxID=1326980 RepID=W7KMT6_9CREN|nr:MAG: hypothetical protein ASUL_03714 [Candidatus Aramenus sulfurataquae]MCL7343784.1 thioredoxin domain-containing protein [Candidatus Aramenus sulfurataquae]